MRLLTVPPRQGMAWMRQGFAAFTRQPLAFSVVFGSFMFGIFVLMLVPLVGPLLLLVALPLATVGFMIATRNALEGGGVSPQVFAQPLRQGRARALAMLQLGLAYAAATVVVVTLSEWIDGGALEQAMDLLARGDAASAEVAEKLTDPAVEIGLLLRLGGAALLSVPFWHAPALVHWSGQGPAQALFSSTVAIWRNRGAFTVYGLAWVGVVIGFAAAVALVFGLLGQPRLAVFAIMPATLLFSTAFYASLWFTFADCFGSATGDDTTLHPITSDTP